MFLLYLINLFQKGMKEGDLKGTCVECLDKSDCSAPKNVCLKLGNK